MLLVSYRYTNEGVRANLRMQESSVNFGSSEKWILAEKPIILAGLAKGSKTMV